MSTKDLCHLKVPENRLNQVRMGLSILGHRSLLLVLTVKKQRGEEICTSLLHL